MKLTLRLAARYTQAIDQTPLTLRHQRIFIVPSRTGLFFLLALLVMLVTAINYQNSLAYGLSFWLLSLGSVSLFLTWRNLAGLRVRCAQPEPGYFPQPLALNLILEGTRGHFGVELCHEKSSTKVDVLAGQPTKAVLYQTPRRRGRLRFAPIKIQSGYPFGLFRAWSWVQAKDAIAVYPAPLAGPFPAALADIAGAMHNASAQGLDDFQGLRPYQPGDSLSRIHWQSIGKGTLLQSKTFGVEGRSTEHLDLARTVGALELRLSVLSYWVTRLGQQQVSFSLTLGAHRYGPSSEPWHVKRCLEALADV